MAQATQKDEASRPVKIACFKSIPNLLKTVIFKYSPKLPPKRLLTLKIDKTDHKAVIYFEVNRWEDKVKRTTLPNLDSCQKFKKRFSCSVKSSLTLLLRKQSREKKAFKALAYILLPYLQFGILLQGCPILFLRAPLCKVHKILLYYYSSLPMYLASMRVRDRITSRRRNSPSVITWKERLHFFFIMKVEKLLTRIYCYTS